MHKPIAIRLGPALLLLIAVIPTLHADWESTNDTFPWATPGRITWAIDYSRMRRPHVKLMLDARFNLIQGGSFTPKALELAKSTPGVHTMRYICSRTIYHGRLFKTNPELKDAAILNLDGSYKIIYRNPARYAGCYNREAWLNYVTSRMDALHSDGIDCIFFDNPMTWACYCRTCQARFRRYAKEKAAQNLNLGQFGRPTELENWFTLDTAERFFKRIHAHARSKGMFIVANNLTYWLVNKGVTDGVFSEGSGHPPFGMDIAAYKIGLAASHGRPTGILNYTPGPVKKARGRMVFNHSRGSGQRPVGAPLAEEFELGYAEGLARGGNYLPNYSLTLGRHIPAMTHPEDKRIQASLVKYGTFAHSHPEVFSDPMPGSPIAVLHSLTTGPRTGQILGVRRKETNRLLWALINDGLPVEVIVEDDLTPKRLKGIRAIIVSDIHVLEPDVAAGLAQFARDGGTVVFAGAPKIRSRYEPDDEAKPVSAYFAELPAIDRFDYGPTQLELSGYQVEGARLKVRGTGRATADFGGTEGPYRVSVSYLDENDGKGRFALEVDGKEIGRWDNDADDDSWHTHATPAVRLKRGTKITVVGHSDGGEYGRIRQITIATDLGTDGFVQSVVGKGRVLLLDTPLTQLAAAKREPILAALRPLCPVRAAAHPFHEKLLLNLTRSDQVVHVHLVNYDFTYGEKYALQAVRPTKPVGLAVPGAKTARLLSPDATDRVLPVTNGTVEVPPVRVYSVVVLGK